MPKMYNKKLGSRVIDHRIRKRIEERDAIVWSIDQSNNVVNVKIQGSDTLMIAHYHQVQSTLPSYVKAGSAVTVRHRRGNKGYVEVIGTGRAIPTPVSNASPLPTTNLEDMILSGLEVEDTDPQSTGVQVSSGTFRYENTLYSFAATPADFYYTMDDPAELIMGTDSVNMGGQYYTITIPAAPSTPQYGRYDIIVVGIDGVLDVISGTEVDLSTTEPTMPTVPTDHVLVDWVFIKYGDSVVTDAMIGATYTTPAAETITVALSGTWVDADDQLTWNSSAPPQPYAVVTISAVDQYGGAINLSNEKTTLTLQAGYGRVWGTYSGWSSTEAESPYSTTALFWYERDQDETEFHPVLVFDSTSFSTSFVIVLLDSLGDPV